MAGFNIDAYLSSPAPQAQPAQPTGYNPPWVGMPANDANQMRQKVYEDAQKRIDKLREVTAKGETVLSELDQFGNLNRKTSTGGAWEKYGPSWGALHSNDITEMNSIQSRLGPQQRIQGSGSSSDRDVSLFMRGLPSIENKGQVNKGIRQDYERQYKNALVKQTFLENYLNKNGHLMGADETWEKQKKALGFDSGSGATKAQKQGDMLQKQSNQSVQDAADAIIGK